MASLYAETPFDMARLDFGMLARPKLEGMQSTYFSLYYEKSGRAFFGEHYVGVQGSGFKYKDGLPSTGTVDGIWWYDFNGDGNAYKQVLQLHSFSAKLADILSVAGTDTLKDDKAFFTQLFGAGDDLNGSDGADVLRGFGGNDLMFGQKGNDTLNGGDGDDFLQGGAGADVLDGGAGSDYADYLGAAKGVTVNLANARLNTGDAAGDTFVSIEKVRGTDHNDRITGNAANNIIDGAKGLDILTGGAGRDHFILGEQIRSNVETITDFSVQDDKIALPNFQYGFDFSRPSGTPGWFRIDPDLFWSSANGTAHDEGDRLLYNSRTGGLAYDADGTGTDAPALVGVLAKGLALTHASFVFFH